MTEFEEESEDFDMEEKAKEEMNYKEFNLSNHLYLLHRENKWHKIVYLEDVKEFIRLLKKEINKLQNNGRVPYTFQFQIHNALDKLAGEKLK